MGLMEALGLRAREPVTRVRMLVSTSEHIAGELYDIPLELADRYIARGYAEGDFSREFSPDELVALRGNPQVVKIGG